MCGIVGIASHNPANQLIYDALLLLQHRGQDAAGIATNSGNGFTMHKANGLVRDVFRTRNMRSLLGNTGIGQVRYPTAGSSSSEEEAQPFYVNAPFGITLAHNGNLTNAEELKTALFKAVAMVHKRVRGSYAVVAQIAGYGLLGFRDPFGIRPMCIGFNETEK